jgi:hypothetical protein
MTEKNESNFAEASFKAFKESPEAAFLTKDCLEIIRVLLVQVYEQGVCEGISECRTEH